MCEVSDRQKKKAMTIMLRGPAKALFARHAQSCRTYQEGIDLLRSRYNNEEKQNRLLMEWQGMRLSRSMQDNPGSSEMEVFQIFAARAMAIQGQLNDGYKGDRYLRDRLQGAIDIPAIKEFLKDRPADTSQQLINRVATHLSGRPRTAGAINANWGMVMDQSEEGDVMYTLGQQYGGGAKRPIKSFVKRGRKTHGREGGRPRRRQPDWMKGIRGYFVCKGDHRANDRHSRDEVTKAINKIKSKQPM